MKTCPQCGVKSEDGAAFCTSCGYHFQDQTVKSAPLPEAAPVPQPALQPSPEAGVSQAGETQAAGGQPYGQPGAGQQQYQQGYQQQYQQQYQQYQQGYQQPYQQPAVYAYGNPYEETYERPVNPCDKMLGIIAVMCGLLGVILAYFGGDVNGERSEYLKFYANEGLVLFLFGLLSIIPVIGWMWAVFLVVCRIIAIVNACKGTAKSVLFFGTIRIIS